MRTQNNFYKPNPRTITTVLVAYAVVLGVVGWLLEGSSAAEDATHEGVVADEVHAAIATNTDGRAYVIVRLEDPVVRDTVTFDEWLARVHDRQQEVLDAFAAGEFELTHRPPRAAGLSGRVNDAGLTRLAAHLLVRAVHLNPMRPPPAIESPAPSAATPSTLQTITAQTAGGTAMGSGAGCDDCITLQPNPQAQNAVNWEASIEPPASDPLAQSETSIAASPVDPGVLVGAWVEGQMEAPQTCTFLQEGHTVLVGLSCDDGDIWEVYDFLGDSQNLGNMKDPATAAGGNGSLYVALLTFEQVGLACILFGTGSNVCPLPGPNPFRPLVKLPGSPSGIFLDKPLISADPNPSALPVEAPRRDRVYVHWTDPDFGIEFTRSFQAGVEGTFLDPPVELHLLPTGHDILVGAVSAVGPDGELYVAWIGTGAPDDEGDEVIFLRRA